VVRNFEGPAGLPPTPEQDFWRLEEDMIINDLAVVEKKIQRIELDLKRGNKSEQDLQPTLQSCLQMLEDNRPIRLNQDLAADPALRGFTFLSAKPQLVIVNNDDDDEFLPPWKREPDRVDRILVRGRLEMDIAAMSQEEAEEFLEAYHIETSALDRVIQKSYELLELIAFFTVLNQEVRAWTLKKGLPALEAAGTVHSDMKQGFIRAEVLSYEDLKEYGSFQEAKKVGKVRLEGKDYTVRDGDIINFRFKV
jgi:ribosome-binding ATPase YchF (GTP1/OBG family)